MDDSDQDFADLCSKLLKRVRKKPGEPRPRRRAEHQPSSQTSDGDKRKRNTKKDGDSGSSVAAPPPVCTGAAQRQHALSGGRGCDSGDAAAPAQTPGQTPGPGLGPRAERGLPAKDIVLLNMQRFRRASPQRMVHGHKPTKQEKERGPDPLPQRPEPCSSGLQPDSDEALALRLQQQLDREAAEAQAVNLEGGGLFFCQICHRDLSHMTPERRTQHLNRCLDDSEGGTLPPPPPPPPPPPGVPECPICGKKFKSQKSRSTHLKRCSSEMGVSPAALLQALQRQAEETQSVPAASAPAQTGGIKRKGASKTGVPTRKRPKKNAEPLDEDTMVAVALSSSLLQQERGAERELPAEIVAASHATMPPVLQWTTAAGKGRGKKRKGGVPRPPPLLLVQDAQAALTRLQDRVSALLLRSRAPSPPTPTRCPSSLRGWSGAAPLWRKSTLPSGGSTCVSDFYAPELGDFITPWEAAAADAASSSAGNKLESSLRPVSEGTPVAGNRASIPSPSTAETGQLPVGSQALRDLMELAEDGITPTQRGCTTSDRTSLSTNLHLSGFVRSEAEEEPDLCTSGFLPETTHALPEGTRCTARRKTDRPGADEERSSHRSVALSRLASDLSSMVNNPQLSDLQLQVDSGEVYFAHSFMAYARCPLLAEMVHESGFGVREDGAPAAQRVLIGDVPGQAVHTLLQYLYTARCSIPASLQPHMLELASRFDLQELQQLCDLHHVEAATEGDEADFTNQDENAIGQKDQAFVEILHSMWNAEDEEDGAMDSDRGQDEETGLEEDRQTDDVTSVEREICEEHVNEEELDEIYEFAATQRKREGEKDSVEEEEEVEDDGEDVFVKLTEPKRGVSTKTLKPNSQLEPDPSLDRSYNRLFSDSWGVYEEKDPSSSPSTSGPPTTHIPQSHKPSFKPSCEMSGRTLLQSSPSVADDFSPSPPPTTSNLPVPGLSPGQVVDRAGGGDKRTDAVEPEMPKTCGSWKRESQGPRSVSVPVRSPQKKKEPELIVLSDSSEEMEEDVAVVCSHSPSPHSPHTGLNLQSYTRIRPQSVPRPAEPHMENKVSSSSELSLDDPPAASAQSHPGSVRDHSPVDCSPEVSWLIPSTPVQMGKGTRTSSTQTKSSICRTQLFPRADTSSPSARPLHSRLQSSSSATGVSSHFSPAEGSDPRLKLEETGPCSSSSDPNFSPKTNTSYDDGKSRGVFAVPPNRLQLSHLSSSTHPQHLHDSSKPDTPLHIHPQPCSSTPLHTEAHHQPPVIHAASPLNSNLNERGPTSQGGDGSPSESSEKSELPSFHLSPLSDPSDRKSSSESRLSVESSRQKSTGAELKSSVRHEEGEGEKECEDRDTFEEAKEESGDAEPSFRQSFMDEPPIAFNDSWGVDGCIDVNSGRFSLRLEDSGGSSQQGQREMDRSSSFTDQQPSPCSYSVQSSKSCGSTVNSSPSKGHRTQPAFSVQAPSPPPPPLNNSLLDSKLWDSWEEEDEEEALPLSQRVKPSALHKTPVSSHNKKKRRSMVPITPMPHYSDMDTPELKNKLNRFGVRPLPKRQMILKLREIHQYTHQLVSSDSEDEASPAAAGSGPASCAPTVRFKEPRAPAALSPRKPKGEEEPLSASQGYNSSSATASEESERSNPVLCLSSEGDSDSDGGISASQVASRLQDRLQAVRSYILSDSELYSQILHYQPLVLAQLQERLKAAGIRLGAAKLVDYLDSQGITFTTAKPGPSAPSRRRGRKAGRGAKAAVERGAKRKKTVTAML